MEHDEVRQIIREELAVVQALRDRPLLDVKEAAERLCLSTWMVYKLLDQQDIESRYIGKRRLVVAESLRSYIENLPNYPEV